MSFSQKKTPPTTELSESASGRPIKSLYVAEDLEGLNYSEHLGDPGEFPFTRGIHETGYIGKLWTMRQFSGFGTPEETNCRYKELLSAGGTGLSVAFDLPTLMGRDPDDEMSAGEVGKCGVSVACLDDMRGLFVGIPLGEITTSMTINSPAAVIFAMYLVVAEENGVSWKDLSGTLQNDILKEYIAQKEYIYPPKPSMRLVTDVFSFCSDYVPRWNTISVSGYHIREAGSTALQELAFTLRNGIEYVEFGMRFGCTDPRSLKLRFHAQTAGVSLTAQQPYNNVVRTALQALAAVLGGANSLHTNGLDEALSLPTKEAALIALRTQQIIAHESEVVNVKDPLGGSYYLEALTRDLETGAVEYFNQIDEMGGMIPAIEQGYPQREIAQSAYGSQQAVESGACSVIGVNRYVDESKQTVPTLYIDEGIADEQCNRIRRLRSIRNNRQVSLSLDELRRAAAGKDNLMPFLLEAVRADATLGEICDAMRDVWGEYEETPFV